jgi:fucose permease
VPAFQLKNAKTATLAFFLFCGIALSAWAPMVPYVKHHLSLSESEMGAMLLALGAGAIVMMPLSGWLISKTGSRSIVVFGSVITAISLPAILLADTVTLTALCLFIFGAGLGGIDIAINAHGIQIQNLSARPIMSSLHGLFSIGGLFGPLLVITLFEFQLSPPSVLGIISILLLIILGTQWKFLMSAQKEREVTRTYAQKNEQEKFSKFAWLNGRLLFLGGLCFIVFLSEGAVLDWSAIYLLDYKNSQENLAGLGYAAFSVAMAFMRLIGDRIVSKFPAKWIVVVGGLITASGFLIVITTPWFLTILIGFILVGLGAANIIPVIFSEGAHLKGVSSASALATITTLGYVGQLAGPAILGMVAELSTLSVAFASTGGLMLLVSISYLLKKG